MISDTSALVCLWTGGAIHKSKNSVKYLESLDLRSGTKLWERCKKIMNNYDQVIKNRKKCILDIVSSEIKQKRITQVVIFGAGWDALSVELVSGIENLKVYELDIANMNEKRLLLKNTDERLAESVHCIQTDLENPLEVYGQLKNNGWNHLKASVLVFEGISYYLTQTNLFGVIRQFKSHSQNVLVIEYLRNNKLKNIPDEIFGVIQSQNDIKITKYDTDKIKSHLEELEGIVIKNYSLAEMEKNRLGFALYFAHRNWINVCHAII